MRESNFSSPAHNRACICISSALYDRRAIDAPSPSLPLVNSLTHLSYLTATSPRIREILSLDGGLERLVRILKGCATGGPPAIDENLAELKGKGAAVVKGPRRSPFKAFNEYKSAVEDEVPDSADVAATVSQAVLPWQVDDHPSTSFSNSSIRPQSIRAKHLLYTYTLAFQCVVNIGVRGSETIRTRVVEAGALDVVVHVLQRYLEDVTRRKHQAELVAKEVASADAATPVVTATAASNVSVAEIVLSPLTRPQLARLDSAGAPPPSYHLAPPVRVATPDTVVSMDEGSAADDNGSSSGQEGDEVMTEDEPRQASSSNATLEKPSSSRRQHIDDDGDIVMQGNASREERPRHRTTASSAAAAAAPPSRQLAAAPTSVPTPTPVNEGVQYRDEDVLLSLQLLAYLSKYPHVRSVFHSASDSIYPEHNDEDDACDDSHHHSSKHVSSSQHDHHHSNADSKLFAPSAGPVHALSSNVFSLVEAFTHRPATNDPYTPRHSNEVQYWAGVIMRNACRKDESRGGIRQCANMQCGVWEKYAREFAKCRRCRKAKYCSKTCQSKAWQFGHRYWCARAVPKEGSAAAMDENSGANSSLSHHHDHHHNHQTSSGHGEHELGAPSSSRRGERRSRRDHDDDDDDQDEEMHAHATAPLGGIDLAAAASAANAGVGARTTLNRIRGITPRGPRLANSADGGATTPPRGRNGAADGGAGGFEVNVAGMGMRVGPAIGLDENDVAHDLLVGGVFGEIGGATGLPIGGE